MVEFAVVTALNALLLAVLWAWADIRPESDWWLRSLPKVALVVVAPNVGSAVLLWRIGRGAIAGAATATALVFAGACHAWDRWAVMTYDRGSVTAWTESVVYVLEALTVSGLGFAGVLLIWKAAQGKGLA